MGLLDMESSALEAHNVRLSINTRLLVTEKEAGDFWALVRALDADPLLDVRLFSSGGAEATLQELLVAFVGAGAFGALVQALISYVRKYDTRELSFTYGEKSVTIRGRSPNEERELLRSLFPELEDAMMGDGYQVTVYVHEPTEDDTTENVTD